MKYEVEYGSTEQFASIHIVKPETVRRSYCLKGHYFKIKPVKRPNGRLVWPLVESFEELNCEKEVA